MRRLTPYMFLLPLIVVVMLFYVIPALSTVLISTMDMGRSLQGEFVGLRNFARMFSAEDPVIGRVVVNTIVYLVGALAITILGGLLLAITSTTIGGKLGAFVRLVWFLPRATPPVVWAFLWIWFFDPTEFGLLNIIISQFGGGTVGWMSRYPMFIVILANGFLGIPYTMTILAAALGNIPSEITEAAVIDGASGLQRALRIQVPLIWWPLSFLTIWHMLAYLTTFQYILMITGGGPFYASTPLSLYTYQKAFGNFELGYGSALALLLIVISALIIIAFRNILGVGKAEE